MYHGRFVAAKINTGCWDSADADNNPSICCKSSLFNLRDASDSPTESRFEANASNSSKNIVEGAWYRAKSNKT